MVLGVYVIFNIVSPLIKNKDVFNFNNIDLEEYTSVETSSVNQTSMNERIKKLYSEELEKDITKKIKEKGYEVEKCKVSVQIADDEEETKINKIKLIVSKTQEEVKNDIENSAENKIVTEIQKIRKIDKKEKINNLCQKINLPILFILVLLVWGSSFILNTPLITVYRFGIYLFMMLLGYYVFSNQELIKKLEKISIQLSLISVVTGICYVYTYYGQNYTDNKILNSFFTNLYLWIMILSIMGIGSKFLNFKNKFTVYIS